ncbi:tyrosine-protein phosphatase non-receptor type 23 isoform X1 [Paramormyrops kingsleyae]|uniref:tyrosine-protein phosphatase non-receptor type 23 isoform X1 n=1 Tax=Paramormyrops kingsleyae TaxID=1676925 RepID=UPI003B97409F
MEAVPRMPMIWLDLKEAGEFQFSPAVRQFILKNYGENPDNYNDQLKKLEQLRQSAVNVTRDFEGCSTLRKYFGQLHYLQSRVPMGSGQEAAVPISWTEIFSGKTVTHDDICYEQACILYNLGALHSMLGAMDNRVSEEGMKVSCTHFQCSAGAFSYLKDHFSHSFSVDMSHQILNLNINLMLGQAQECLLEKSMLDNRKSFLVARISAQVVDYYREACWTLENSDTASLLGKIQKDWKKLVQMKIYYFAAIAHLHMGKQAEEQQKYGERLAYLQSSLDKLNEAMKLAKGQPDSVQDALRFTMDVIGGKFNSAKKDNDFIYHESVPALDTLPSVKGAPLVKGLPVNPTDPSVTGPDIFSKLVPMAAHEASSLYSEEKAKLLREVMAKIDSKNETLEQFMDSLCLDPNTVDNLGMYEHIPPVLMERCAALSVRPDTVKSLVQSMQVLSGVFTDVEASLREIRDVLDEDEAGERSLEEAGVKPPPQPPPLAELRRDLEKYLEAHEKASFTNTELHRAMNLHVPHLRLLGGPLDSLRETLPHPQLSEDELASLHCMKRILGKVQEMRDQRSSLEKQLRDLIQQDDITSVLVTTERADMKKLFEEQLKKYDQVKLYIDQNLAAQENILKALTEANVQYAMVRKGLTETEHKWNNTVQMLVSSYEAYEDLMKKSQEGREFYQDLEGKASQLLEKARGTCKAREEERRALLERELQKKAPPRPTAPKPPLQKKPSEMDSSSSLEDPELAQINAAILSLGGDVPEELRSMPPDMSFPVVGRVGARPPGPDTFLPGGGAVPSLHWPIAGSAPYAQLPRFPPQPAPPGSLPQPPHTSQPHFPQPSPVPGYAHPQSQPCPPGGAVVVRPSTTTVDSVQTPIPSYAPTLRHAMPPITSTGYMPPPQMGHFPQYPPQARMPPQGYPQPQAPFPLQPPQVQGQYPRYMPPHFQQPAFAGQLPPLSHPGLPAPPPRPGYPPPHVMSGSHPVPPASQAQVSPYPGQTPMPRATIPPHQPQLPPASGPAQPSMPPGVLPHQPQLPPASGPAQHPLPHGILHSVPPGVLLHQPQQPQLPSVSVPSKSQLPPGVLPHQPQMPPASALTQPSMPPGVLPHQPQMPPASAPSQPSMPPGVLPHQPQMPPASALTQPSMPPGVLPHQPQMTPASAPSQPSMPPGVLPHQPQMPPASALTQPSMPPGVLPHQPQMPPASALTQPSMPPGVLPHQPQMPPASAPSQPLLPHGVLPHQPQMPPASAPSQPLPPAGHLPPNAQLPLAPLPGLPQQSGTVCYTGGGPVLPQPPAGPVQPQSSCPSYCPPTPPPGGHVSHPAPPPPPMLPPGSGSSASQPPSMMSPSPSPVLIPQHPSPSPSLTGSTGVAHLPHPGSASSPPVSSASPPPASGSGPLFQRMSSSTDDLLSSSPEGLHGGPKAAGHVLLPTKADPQDGQRSRQPAGVRLIEGDPYGAPGRIQRLREDLERFGTEVQALAEPAELDGRWRELQEQQERDVRQLSIAVARCYSMKNRRQDVMPYDCNRVLLSSGKDDYINASTVGELSPYCPHFIATQAPLPGTAADFWLMVYEQKVSVVVMLVSEQELEKQKVPCYFPSERGQQLSHGPIVLTLTTQKATPTHVERMISLQYRDQSLRRTIIHLQFTSWPELGLPDSQSNLIRFIQEVHGHYLHQRPLHTPIVVHCSSGVGRTGAFCLLYAALQELDAGNDIPDLLSLVRKMRQQRKNMLQEKLHLKFCYEAVLMHAEQVLQRHGIPSIPCNRTPNSAVLRAYSRQESQDIVLGGDMPISSIQATIAKLSIRPPSSSPEQGSILGSDLPGNLEPSSMTAIHAPYTAPQPLSLSPPHSLSPSPPMKVQSPPPPTTEQGNSLDGSVNHLSGPTPAANHHPTPPQPTSSSSSSSLELLASLTPEAFTLDSSSRGKPRINKQSFLQPHNGQGLQRDPSGDDPLSSLDPLWTLNKT